jgi:hypothetical protein
MKSIKLLLISFTMTLIVLVTISPAIAKPSVNVQHLQVNKTFTSGINNYEILAASNNVTTTASNQYRNNFSTGLILSSPSALIDENTQVAMTVVNKSNEFFASAMNFSDKLNQFISYFTAPEKDDLSYAAPENKVIRKKCNSKSKNNYS